MKKHAFEIYNASAGSGKTYTLVKEYLKIILSSKRDDAYKNILAITFTNKAVEEMKSRIVSALKAFSKDIPDEKSNSMLLEIARETELEPKEIQEKSRRIIKNIIHNYASFDISTIDKFTHRVIRSFALDLDLSLSFEVSLDTESLLEEAVDRVIAEAGEDENLTRLLVDFATEKADDDKSWDVTRDFLEISKLLTNENNRTEIAHFQDKTISDFLKIKQNILKICKDLESDIISMAQNSLLNIENKGIEYGSFTGSYVPNHLKKIADGNIEIKTAHYKYLDENLQDSKPRSSSKVPQHQKDLVNEIALDVLQTLKTINQQAGKLFFYKAFLKNLTPLSILNTVNQELLKIQQDQNILSISEFNNIIHKEIKEQPAPFIYEKLGDRYTHFFIDEFQDTSQMQWENLLPLIDNSLSGEDKFGERGSLMIVGDPKQSIYRWRGGKAEQFIELAQNKSPFSNPEKLTRNLETNYRSYSEIITFNNDFFTFLANDFSEESYKKLYLESAQKINQKTGGYVNISFLDQEDQENDDLEKDNPYLSAVFDTVQKVYSEGFSYGEIVVLVRRNQEGTLIANYLTQHNIPIISSDSLLISNSDQVIFLVNLLEYIKNKNNAQAKANFLYYLGRNLNVNPIHNFLKKGTELKDEKEFENWLKEYGISFSFEKIRRKPLYEATEILTETFLKNVNNVYVQSFLDLVLEQNIRTQSGIDEFLDFWKNKGYKKSIPSPKGNAVQIMSIHKSKGLEFPVVIFPFADQNYSRGIKEKLWIDNELKEIELEKVLIDNSKSVENYSEKASEAYFQKNQEELLDNINVLYVALTRTVEQLHIFSKMNFNSKGELLLSNSMASLFIRFLQNKELFNSNQLIYEFGETTRISLPKTEKENRKTILPVEEKFDTKNIKIATLEALMWNTGKQKSIEYGNLLHEILSLINSETDIDIAVERSLEKGLISLNQKTEITEKLKAITQHPELKDFYNPNYKILNERTIVRTENSLIKPDKVVLKPNNEALILDYKTGEKSEKYKSQIENYALTLKEMGFSVTQKILVYIGENIEVI